ncbi:alpha-L-fucosidase [Silvibacterium acidisoli]|uniref:alpha-L-fucosidase n=1 Tax=Acidobacteriaceae bacterium ZG23-2 TaxID=2883246 RepID=UPI00406C7CBE
MAKAQQAAATPLLQLQQEFLNLRFGMFIHLNMATFEEREWGDAKASPKLFNPAHLDTDQWAQAARSANMGYGCLTTKHHDGFCLWPTATSSPSVKDSSFPHDIVRSYVDSFRRQGLKVCLYFSILDLRADIRAYQIDDRKIALIKAQLTELLTNYGEITALIIDGWSAAWSRIYYDQLPFRVVYDHVKSLQPNCLVADHNFGSYPVPLMYYTDIKEYEQHAGQAVPAGSRIPSQSGMTLQSDWFWKKSYPTQELKSAKQIVDEWLVPFNRQHCNLILNLAPNTDGRFDDNAVARLAEVGKLWQNTGAAPAIEKSIQITTPNLAYARPSFASSIADTSGPDLANDNDFRTSWTADDGKADGWVEIDLKQPARFNTVTVVTGHVEGKPGESSIGGYRVECQREGVWSTIAGSNVASVAEVHQFPPVEAEKIRVSVTGAEGQAPSLVEIGVYNEPS